MVQSGKMNREPKPADIRYIREKPMKAGIVQIPEKYR